MNPTLYTLCIAFTSILGIISYTLTIAKNPIENKLYSVTSSLLLTYSIGASLLLYGMMLYLFSAFPQSAPLSLLMINSVLLLISMWTIFLNPWQVQNRKNGRSGLPSKDPAFVSVTIASVFIFCALLFMLAYFRAFEQRLSLLILFQILIIHTFFLTSGSINSYALNNFTSNF